jgi:hypothetical protein
VTPLQRLDAAIGTPAVIARRALWRIGARDLIGRLALTRY